MRAVPAPFQPAAAAASERVLVDPAGWMRPADAAGELGALQAAVFADRRVRLRYRSSGQQRAAERVVDPYGLVCKSGVWYLVADSAGEPRLFRVSRVEAVLVTEEAVIRRDGVSLADRWEELRRQVDERPTPVRVLARVRRTRLDMFSRMFAAHLAENPADGVPTGHARVGPPLPGDGEWADLTLRFAAVQAARVLLSFGGDVVVTSPPEVRDDLLAVAAEVTACYAPGWPTGFSAGLSTGSRRA